jgi:hypothetical protein
LIIGEFEKTGEIEDSKLMEKAELHAYLEPMDTISGSMAEDQKLMNAKKHAHIDMVKVYVNYGPMAPLLSGTRYNPKGEALDDLSSESLFIRDLTRIEGVAAVSVNPETEVIKILPKTDEMFILYDVWHRIESEPGYDIVKMDIVASGNLEQINLPQPVSIFRAKLQERYALVMGRYTGIILADNEKLDEILKSDDKAFTIRGTVTSFRDEIPVVVIKDFAPLSGELAWLR